MKTPTSPGGWILAWLLVAFMTILVFAVHWRENSLGPPPPVTAEMSLADVAQAHHIDTDSLVEKLLGQRQADNTADLPRHLAISMLSVTADEVADAACAMQRDRARLPAALKVIVWGVWLVGVILFVAALNQPPAAAAPATDDAVAHAPPPASGNDDPPTPDAEVAGPEDDAGAGATKPE